MSKSQRYLFFSVLSAVFFILVLLFNITNAYASSPAWSRLAGDDRYKTAVEISKAGWPESENVVLATGENFPDALCAAPLAKQLGAPILLTGMDNLNDDTLKEIIRLKAKKIYIIGGQGVISDNIKNSLENMKLKVERLWGNDRYETTMAVENYMAANYKISKKVMVVTGENFPDALSVSPIAAKLGMPIILVPNNNLPPFIKNFLDKNGITNSYVIGDSGIISDSIAQQFPGMERIFGIDKYERNIAVLNKFADEIKPVDGTKQSTYYVATGGNYPDALAGSVLAAMTSSPIILTDKNPFLVTQMYINSKLASIEEVKALGGDKALPSTTMDLLVYKVVYNVGLKNALYNNCLVISEKDEFSVFKDRFSISKKIDGADHITPEELLNYDAVILLEYPDFNNESQCIKDLFSYMNLQSENFVNVDIKDQRLLVYIKAQSKEALMFLLNKISFE